jgi:hypothetical protein
MVLLLHGVNGQNAQKLVAQVKQLVLEHVLIHHHQFLNQKQLLMISHYLE